MSLEVFCIFNIDREPNFDRLKKVLKNDGKPDMVPFYELFADKPIMEKILGRPLNNIKDLIDYQYKLGYDYVTISGSRHFDKFKFPANLEDIKKLENKEDTGNLNQNRSLSKGVINNWEDFEKYPWPKKNEINFSAVEEAIKLSPEEMGVFVRLGHNLEYTMEIMGFENLSYSLYDQPDLVEAIFEQIGAIMFYVFKVCAQIDGVKAVEIADDMGYKTNTILSPNILRKYVFPWYKKYVNVCHENDTFVILHSCGQIESIIPDLIKCGIDAKHSFEDNGLSVIDFYKKYGDLLAVLGGIDIDFLCRANESEVRKKTREVLKTCMPGGGYALGTGNSVAEYVPVENYLAMLDEGQKRGVY